MRSFRGAGALTLALSLAPLAGCAGDDGTSGGSSQGSGSPSTSSSSGPGTSAGPGGTSRSGGSSSSGGTSTTAGSTSGATAGTTAGSTGATGGTGGSGWNLPETVDLKAGPGGTVLWASLCQSLALGGGLNYYLMEGGFASNCPGGEVFVTFQFDSSSMEYALDAGTVLTENFDGPPVTFASTSHGMIEQDPFDMSDLIRPLPEATSISVTTGEGASLSFEFSGAQVTLTAFSAP